MLSHLKLVGLLWVFGFGYFLFVCFFKQNKTGTNTAVLGGFFVVFSCLFFEDRKGQLDHKYLFSNSQGSKVKNLSHLNT